MVYKTKIIINGENHTIGKLLEYIFKKNYNITYCSYELPHPLKQKIIFFIESKIYNPSYSLLSDSCVILRYYYKFLLNKFIKTFNSDLGDYSNR